jgi:hypothetical protein
MWISASPIIELLVNFSSTFTAPSFANFTTLAVGWIICTGRHSISRVIQFAPDGLKRNHCCFYRFFSRAQWQPPETTSRDWKRTPVVSQGKTVNGGSFFFTTPPRTAALNSMS